MGPSIAVGHHVGPEVAAIDPAKRDGAAVTVDRTRLARNVVLANECAQVFCCCSSRRPVVGAVGASERQILWQVRRRARHQSFNE